MVLRHYGIRKQQGQLAIELGSTEEAGTSPESIHAFLVEHKLMPVWVEPADIWTLRHAVDGDRVAIVAFQEWKDTPIDYRGEWECGHYSIVSGYDDSFLYLHDPSFETVIGYEYFDFMKRWHDYGNDGEKRREYNRLAIIA